MTRPRGGKTLSRRQFLRCLGGGIALTGAASCLPHVEGEWGSCPTTDAGVGPLPASNRVVEVSAPGLVDLQKFTLARPDQIPAMLGAGLLALTQAADLAAAWRAILPNRQAGEIVGLKVNTLLAAKLKTSREIVLAIVQSLRQDAGVPAAEILVWDRTQVELERAGFTEAALGVPCQGTLVSISDPTGPGYEAEPVCLSGQKIYLSRILTRTVKHLINVPVLKNHAVAAFTGCLKNHYGSFSRPQDFHTGAQEHVARLNALPEITRVARLNVMEAFISVMGGDTQDPADCAPERLLVGLDPVALDRRGLEIRDEMRTGQGYPAGAPAPYLDLAAQLGVGAATYDRVPIVVD